MLYPKKVQEALEASLPAFQKWEERHSREMEGCARALDRLAGLTADEVAALLEDQRGSSGALPSLEYGWPLVIPFPHQWSCHEEARNWAFHIIQGVTTLAVDGSQIPPSKDYSLSVAAIQVAWFQNPHRPEGGHLKDARFQLLQPAMQSSGSEGGSMSLEVNTRRFEAEVEEIIRCLRSWDVDPKRPPVAFFDGTLVVSFATTLAGTAGQPYFEAVMNLLRASQDCRVPVVGYVDTSHAKDLCTMLARLEGKNPPEGVNDAHLLMGKMKWGDRSRAFICARDETLNHYRREGEDYRRKLAFFYLQTTGDGPPARVDIPEWVVRDGLVDHVADVVRCEVIAGTGYPYCFQAVDAAAVLSVHDREAFYGQVQAFCESHGMTLRMAPKAASKRRRRV